MKFGILGALPEEVALMKRSMTVQKSVKIGSRTFHEGLWEGKQVVLALSRVGKVAAAVTTTLLIEHFEVTHILFSGVAGAIDPQLRVGDIVIADQLVQHDMNARPIFPQFEIPLLGKTEFTSALADDAVSAARTYISQHFSTEIPVDRRAPYAITTPSIWQGLTISGDQFVWGAEHAAALRTSLPATLCVEMEGAAVAQVCYELGNVPFAIIRVISDRADHTAHIDFQKFIGDIAEYLTGGIVREMLRGKPEVLKAKG